MNKKKKSKKSNTKKKAKITVIDSQVVVKSIDVKETKVNPISLPVKHDYLSLPVEHIKSDMIGMLVFSLLAICSIFLLKKYNVSLEMIFSYLASLR